MTDWLTTRTEYLAQGGYIEHPAFIPAVEGRVYYPSSTAGLAAVRYGGAL